MKKNKDKTSELKGELSLKLVTDFLTKYHIDEEDTFEIISIQQTDYGFIHIKYNLSRINKNKKLAIINKSTTVRFLDLVGFAYDKLFQDLTPSGNSRIQ